MTFIEALDKRLLFFDGAMGTMLQSRGLAAGEQPELWNLSQPDVIRDIHLAYLRAGCQIIKTNTFGANGLKIPKQTKEVIRAGVKIAKEAVSLQGGNGWVAFDVGPTGKLLKPLGDLDFEKAYDVFKEMCLAGADAGADLILIETMSDTLEAKAALLAAKENTGLPVVVTMIFDEQGKLLTGADIPGVVALLEGLGADAIGLNCGLGPHQAAELLPQFLTYSSVPVVVNPNAGLPRTVDGETVFDIGPDEFAEAMRNMAALGARLIGGCCGTTPEHLAKMAEVCKTVAPRRIEKKNYTVVSSYSKTVMIGEQPIVIGERINPTGKKLFKEALRNADIGYILREGLAQQDKGAEILDVNVGLPEIDEERMMSRVVFELQSVLDLPLQIDSADPKVLERALRQYNGKAMVNSVNGKKESMDAVFPLVKKYGGVVVALTLDESGIPETPEGRLQVAEKIVETAAAYGIDKKDIVVDALTMTVSSSADAAKNTLASLKLIKETLQVKTILGVSNVSFGLPQREGINATFFTLALYSGLDAAIINPCSEAMMRIYYSYLALTGQDPNFETYINTFSAASPQPAKQEGTAEISLYEAIVRGLKDKAGEAAAQLVQTEDALKIIDGQMIPALNEVGRGFEAGTVFLPRLLMSAEAAKSAFSAIKEHLIKAGAVQQKKEKIVLATVKGDIHDIGKNIVKVLLENYGYDVIDLGKDVDEKEIVRAAQENDVQLVGLSALMTTTVANMKKAIEELRSALPSCKVMVGGAVLTPEYATMIGADYYGKDAMAAVYIAQKLFHHD